MTSKQLVKKLVKDAVFMGRITGCDPKITTSYEAAMVIQTMTSDASEGPKADLRIELEQLWADMDARHSEVPTEFLERLSDIISLLE